MQRAPAVPFAHIAVMTGSFGAFESSRGKFSILSKSILPAGFLMGDGAAPFLHPDGNALLTSSQPP